MDALTTVATPASLKDVTKDGDVLVCGYPGATLRADTASPQRFALGDPMREDGAERAEDQAQ